MHRGGGSLLTAFTMAEILLSLTIIGVVAAITLPSLTGNINERTWNTQRKALYARMSQAIALMPAVNGYGTVVEATSTTSAVDTAAETFITDGLAKVLKINNICDSEHLEDCGMASEYMRPDGTKRALPTKASELTNILTSGIVPAYSHYDTKTAAFETANGESITLIYMPDCKPSMNETSYYLTQTKLCAVMIFDLNGKKGPNTFGKDMGFMSVTYPTDPVVSMPIPYIKRFGSANFDTAVQNCRSIDGGEYRLPTKEEAAAMVASAKLFTATSGTFWTSTTTLDNGVLKIWIQGFGGDINPVNKNSNTSSQGICIKRF